MAMTPSARYSAAVAVVHRTTGIEVDATIVIVGRGVFGLLPVARGHTLARWEDGDDMCLAVQASLGEYGVDE